MAEVAERKRSPIMLIVELFGVVSAATFILSAVMSWIALRLAYRVNFYSIATPADIVMGGFLILGLIAVFTLFGFLFAIIIDRVMMPLSRRDRTKPVTFAMLDNISPVSPNQVYFVGSAIVSLFAAIYVMIIHPVITQQKIPYYLQSGLRIADVDAPAACQGGDVEWLGSNAAIVRCGDRVMVIRDAAKLTMEPRPRSHQ